MRIESASVSVFRFWLLRPDAWGPLLLASAAASLLSIAWPDLPTETVLLSVGLLTLGVAMCARSFITVTDPPRAVAIPGWVGAHRRWLLVLVFFAAAAVGASWHLRPMPMSTSVMFAAIATSVGLAIGSELPDRVTGVKRSETSLASWLGFTAAVIGFPAMVYFATSMEAQMWLIRQEPALRQRWAGLLREEHPLTALGACVASALVGLSALASMSRRGQSLFSRRPRLPTFGLRRPLHAKRPLPGEAGRPALLATTTPPLLQPSWRLAPAPRTSLGRGLLFLQNTRIVRVPWVWLVWCPVCIWLLWSLQRDHLPGEHTGPRVPWGLAAFVTLLASVSPAARLISLRVGAAALPRSVLLPQSRERALRSRLLLDFARGVPLVTLVVAFLGSGLFREASFTSDLVTLLVACLLAIGALSTWSAVLPFLSNFDPPGGRLTWWFALGMGLFGVPLGALWIASRFPAVATLNTDGRVLVIVCFGVCLMVATSASGFLLRCSRRWDLAPR